MVTPGNNTAKLLSQHFWHSYLDDVDMSITYLGTSIEVVANLSLRCSSNTTCKSFTEFKCKKAKVGLFFIPLDVVLVVIRQANLLLPSNTNRLRIACLHFPMMYQVVVVGL